MAIAVSLHLFLAGCWSQRAMRPDKYYIYIRVYGYQLDYFFLPVSYYRCLNDFDSIIT